MKKIALALAGLAVLNMANAKESDWKKMPSLDNKIQEMRNSYQSILDEMAKAESFDLARWKKIEKDEYKYEEERINKRRKKRGKVSIDKIKDEKEKQEELIYLEASASCSVGHQFYREKRRAVIRGSLVADDWEFSGPNKKELSEYWRYIKEKCYSTRAKYEDIIGSSSYISLF